MPASRLACLVVLVVASAASARADGLIYQLPKDGTWVRYDMELVEKERGGDDLVKASFVVASVGTAKEGGQPCRWIEFRMTMHRGGREHTELYKVLVPEKHLTRGGSPIDHVIRAWKGLGGDGMDYTAREIDEPESARDPLPAFLAGPPKDGKKLDPEVVETKLGKLKCEGLTGSFTFGDDAAEARITYTTRLHEKSPFGVVTCSMDYEVSRGGRIHEEGTIKFTFAESGTGAESKIPESK